MGYRLTGAIMALLAGATRSAAELPDSANAGKSGVHRTAADFLAGRLEFSIVRPQHHAAGGQRLQRDVRLLL